MSDIGGGPIIKKIHMSQHETTATSISLEIETADTNGLYHLGDQPGNVQG